MSKARFVKLDKDQLSPDGKKLKDFLDENFVYSPGSGQERAVKRVIRCFEHARSPLWRNERPVMCGLLLGPSGVGKTELASLLARYFTGNAAGYTSIECSNYETRYTLSELLGSPPGYIGYDDTPKLAQDKIEGPILKKIKSDLLANDDYAKNLSTEIDYLSSSLKGESDPARYQQTRNLLLTRKHELNGYVRRSALAANDGKLWSVVLFDEIERAHEVIHNFLLQVTSKGWVTLRNGNITEFYNSFVIMTSNLASEEITRRVKGGSAGIGFDAGKASNLDQSIYTVAMENVRKFFKSEFLGRIEKDIVAFDILDRSEMERIMELRIKQVITHLSKNHAINLVFQRKVKDFLLNSAMDHPEYGARLIKNKIDKHVEEPLGILANSGQVKIADTIVVYLEGDQIEFCKLANPDELTIRDISEIN